MKVFLAGVDNGSHWRENIISKLKIDFFDPNAESISDDTGRQCRIAHKSADYILYVITPKMNDCYIVSELIDETNKNPHKVLYYFAESEDDTSFSKHQVKSLVAVGKMVRTNGSQWFETFDEVVNFLNAC